MKVENLMTAEPTTCSVADDLASVTKKMWEDDCGILPVLEDGELVGVITDRDIAMALGMRSAAATEVSVAQVVRGEVVACEASEEVSTALALMEEHKVRRIAVVTEGRLVGLLSLNDIILEAASKPGPQKKPTYSRIVKALQAICEHRKLPAVA